MYFNRGLRGDEVAVTAIALPEESSTEVELEVVEKVEVKPKPTFKDPKPLRHVAGPREVVFKALERWLTIKTLNWLRKADKSCQDVASIEENLRCMKVETNVTEAATEFKPAVGDKGLNRYDRSLEECKVRAFLSGQIEYSEDVRNDSTLLTDTKHPKNESLEETVTIVMPLANLSAQKVLRKKIVMDYVEKWYSYMIRIRVIADVIFPQGSRN